MSGKFPLGWYFHFPMQLKLLKIFFCQQMINSFQASLEKPRT